MERARRVSDLPTCRDPSGSTSTGRRARITVLTSGRTDARTNNLFTLIRHRRPDSLGPWANVGDESWSHEDLDHGLLLSTFDASLDRCQAYVEQILKLGTLDVDGLEVSYSLEHTPRYYGAYRDSVNVADVAMRSPFSRHSSEIVEYWSFATEPRERWLDTIRSMSGQVPSLFTRLGFPLERRVERVGNLMIAGAQDEVTCDLRFLGNETLRFRMDADKFLPDAYRATVWARHSGDEVFHQQVSATSESILIDPSSDVDRIGFSVYRAADGRCVDLYAAPLVKEIHTRLSLDATPQITLYGKRANRPIHTVKPSSGRSATDITIQPYCRSIDKHIRQWWLDSKKCEFESKARSEKDLFRFLPSELEQAARHFINLVSRRSDYDAPVYLADRYFMRGCKEAFMWKLYLDVFAATSGGELRILCAAPDDEVIWPWWSSLAPMLRNHVSIRSFRDYDGRPGFHDRYLITPDRETVMTNSFNGWTGDGVTFWSHAGEVYRAEAERLWAMEVESESATLRVREVV